MNFTFNRWNPNGTINDKIVKNKASDISVGNTLSSSQTNQKESDNVTETYDLSCPTTDESNKSEETARNNAPDEVNEFVDELINSGFELDNDQLMQLYSCETREEAVNVYIEILYNYYNKCYGFSKEEVDRLLNEESFESVFNSNYEVHIQAYLNYLVGIGVRLSTSEMNSIKNAGSLELSQNCLENIQRNQLINELSPYGFSETDINRIFNGEITVEQLYEEIMTEEDPTRRYNMSLQGVFDALVNPEDFSGSEYKEFPDFNEKSNYNSDIISNLMNKIVYSPDELTDKDLAFLHMYMSIRSGNEVDFSGYKGRYGSEILTDEEENFYNKFINNESYKYLSEEEKSVFYYICNTEGYAAGFDYLTKLDYEAGESLARLRSLSENFDTFEEMLQYADALVTVRPLLIEDYFNDENVKKLNCCDFFKNYDVFYAGAESNDDIDRLAKETICYYTYIDKNGIIQISYEDPRASDALLVYMNPEDYNNIKSISYYDVIGDTDYYKELRRFIVSGNIEKAEDSVTEYYNIENELLKDIQPLHILLEDNQTNIEYLWKMRDTIKEEADRYTYLELEYTRQSDFEDKKYYNSDFVTNIMNRINDSYQELSDKDIVFVHMYMSIESGTAVDFSSYKGRYGSATMTTNENYFYSDFIEHEWYRFLTDTEKEVFYYICNTEGYSAGFDYLMKLDNYLDRRCANEQKKEAAEEANGFLAHISSYFYFDTFKGFSNLFYSLDCWISGREIRMSQTFSASEVWRSEYIAGISSDFVRFYYNTKFTLIDIAPTIVAGYLTGGCSVVAQTAIRAATTFATMGVKTYSSTLNMALELGLSDSSAILLAVCSCAIETAMESWSISHLFGAKEALSATTTEVIGKLANIFPKSFQNIFTRVATFVVTGIKQALIEVDEEICTLFLNKFAEGLIAGELSTYAQQMDYYIGCGYSESEAAKMLGNEFKDELIETAIMSFVSGFIMKSTTNAIDSALHRNTAVAIADNIMGIYKGTNPGSNLTQARATIRECMIAKDYTSLISIIMNTSDVDINARTDSATKVIDILDIHGVIDTKTKKQLIEVVNGIASGTIDTNLNEQQISLDAVKLYDVDDMETTLELYPQHEQSLAEEVTPNLSIKQPEGYFYQPGDLVSEQEKLSDIITEKLFDADDMETTLELYPQHEQQISLDAVKLYDVDDMEAIVDATTVVSNDEVININETPSINDSILTSIESLSMDERVEILSSNTELTLDEKKFIINSLSFEELSNEQLRFIWHNFWSLMTEESKAKYLVEGYQPEKIVDLIKTFRQEIGDNVINKVINSLSFENISFELKYEIFEKCLDIMTDESIEKILKTYPQKAIIYVIDEWFRNRDVPNAVVSLINSLSLENLDDGAKEVLVGNLAHLLEENLFNQIKNRITHPDAMVKILLKNNLLSSEYKSEIINSLSFESLSDNSKELIIGNYLSLLNEESLLYIKKNFHALQVLNLLVKNNLDIESNIRKFIEMYSSDEIIPCLHIVSLSDDYKSMILNSFLQSLAEEVTPILSVKQPEGYFYQPVEIEAPLKNMVEFGEQNISKYQQQIEDFASRLGITYEIAYDALNKKIKQLIDTSAFGIRTSVGVLELVLDDVDGRFKNQFETNTSKGLLNTSVRTDVEQDIINVPKNTLSQDRPIYGMAFPQISTEIKSNPNVFATLPYDIKSYYASGPGTWYGDFEYGVVCIFKKDSVIDNVSFTLGDSLDYRSRLVASSATDPRFCGSCDDMLLQISSLDNLNNIKLNELMYTGDKYLELQFHGVKTHSIDNLEMVIFQSIPSLEILNKLIAKGIQFKIINKNLDY